MQRVILVDKDDNELGTMEKMEAHQKGYLHRAFSVLIYNSKGEMLLQKRARKKYHSGGLWTNACCSHPAPDETMQLATQRRIKEELGIDLIPEFSHKFIYRAELDNSLVEHEFDHVYVAKFDGQPSVDANEIEDWKFVAVADLKEDVRNNPDRYTPWFKLIMEQDFFEH
jgi:isopentenyl-diphosphate delta-isomerase